MKRGRDERIADLRRLLAAARALHADRERLAPDIAQETGLSLQGEELGYESLEREASDGDLSAIVAGAGDARHVLVVLSANVFVAPLRALVLARAAAGVVTVRASPRGSIVAGALVQAAADPAIGLVEEERDVARSGADEIHVYGRTETVAAVRARAGSGVLVRGHASGMGAAWITAASAAPSPWRPKAVSRDVATFDQRGCLSSAGGPGRRRGRPRPAVRGGARRKARGLGGQGAARTARRRRGRAEATRWRQTMAFAGQVREGRENVVAVASGPAAPIPPPGRHLLVLATATPADAGAWLGAHGRFIVSVGSEDPRAAASIAPAHVRVSLLGRMQLPALDGPVDRRR